MTPDLHSLVPPNILIVRFSSIGDLLLTTPLLRAIRERHPDSRITYVVREDMADTLRNNSRITQLVTWERGSPLVDLALALRRQEWTHRLDLHCSLRSYALRRLVGGRWHGYPKHRIRRKLVIATRGKRGGALQPVAERYFAAAEGLDVAPDQRSLEFFTTPGAETRADELLERHGLGKERPLVALAPGAAHFTKRWPERHWVALIRQLGRDHDVLVLGGKAEEVLGARVADASPGLAVSVAGQFRHDTNAAILKRTRTLVAGDTGLLHLATAVGTPVIGLYGPTVEAFGFFPYHAMATPLQLDLPCRPCSSQGTARCPLKDHHCMEQLEPAAVLAALARNITP
jgi:lipopolysaccharide heptosyltransferase II